MYPKNPINLSEIKSHQTDLTNLRVHTLMVKLDYDSMRMNSWRDVNSCNEVRITIFQLYKNILPIIEQKKDQIIEKVSFDIDQTWGMIEEINHIMDLLTICDRGSKIDVDHYNNYVIKNLNFLEFKPQHEENMRVKFTYNMGEQIAQLLNELERRIKIILQTLSYNFR